MKAKTPKEEAKNILNTFMNLTGDKNTAIKCAKQHVNFIFPLLEVRIDVENAKNYYSQVKHELECL